MRASPPSLPLAVLIVALASGCQLLIGDIELPDEEVDGGGEPGWDAAAHDAGAPDHDASTPDAATPEDGGAPEAGADDGVDLGADWDLPDAAPDAALPDMMPPPVEVAALEGRWHVYGLAALDERRALTFEAELVVADGGRAVGVYTFDGEPLYEDTVLVPHPDHPSRLRLNLFPVAGVLTGRVEGTNGLGLLVNDVDAPNPSASFAVMVKAEPPGQRQSPLPYLAHYARLDSDPETGAGEQGVFRGDPEARTWVEQSRWAVGSAEGAPDRALGPIGAGPRRWFFELESGATWGLSASEGSVGVFGRVASPDGTLGGLYMGWSPSAAAQGQPYVPGLFYCGLLAHDDDGMRVEGVEARISAVGTWRWRTGEEARVVREGGEATLQGDHPLFGPITFQDLFDPAERVHFLRPLFADGSPQWGAGLCVRAEE